MNNDFYPCQCRSFFMSEHDFNESRGIITGQVIESLFKNWWMLEMVVLHADENHVQDENLSVTLSQEQITSTSLRILSMKNIQVHIENKDTKQTDMDLFENWKSIEFFRINNGLKTGYLPQQLSKWTELKYFSIIGAETTFENIDVICNFNNLEYLSLENNTEITELPFECLEENDTLKKLRYINLVNVDVFNASILELHSLRQYVHYFGDITMGDLLELDVDRIIDKETDYYLQGTQLCREYDLRNITAENEHIFKWINITNACNMYSPLDLDLNWDDMGMLNICPPMKWRNGICDDECNIDTLLYDGGDCTQLCDFSKCDIFESWSIENDECNEECNNEQCLYDQYRC